MSKNRTILVIGRHLDILDKIILLLTSNGYAAVGTIDNEKAVQMFNQTTFDAVIIGGGVDSESRSYFHTTFQQKIPQKNIIDAHPSTILSNLNDLFYNKNMD